MTRHGPMLIAFAVVGILAVGTLAVAFAVTMVAHESAAIDQSCSASLHADQAKVRTERWPPLTDELPGTGDYVEIHWQTHAAGNPCARAPGPTDWHYQGIIRLRPDDAQALASAYDWRPLSPSPSPGTYQWDTPSQMWPQLTQFAPADAQWLHSQTYATTHFQHARWGDLYLDRADALAFFVEYDH